MATVYLARQTDLDRDVALKELRAFVESEPALARRFLREARLAGSLSHPNIVTVHDYFEHEGTPYMAMEYLSRGSLRPYVGRMSLAQIGGVLEGVLGGLAHAETRRVVHRDLKPENILVTADGWVKIADFGIAKAASATNTGPTLTTTGTTLGTPRYMAPERAMDQDVGPWSDLYSLGVIVFELLVGRTPFHDTDAPMAILMRQVNDPVPAVSSLAPDVDPALSDWIERLLVKDPAQRTRSAGRAWEELDGILVGLLGPSWLNGAGLPARVGEPPGRRSRTPGSAGRRPTTGATAVVEETGAPTVAPSTLGMDRRPARRARGLRRAAVLALVVVGLIVAVAAAGGGGTAARGGGSGGAGGGASGAAGSGTSGAAGSGASGAAAKSQPSGVGDSKSDDPSDDEPDENGD